MQPFREENVFETLQDLADTNEAVDAYVQEHGLYECESAVGSTTVEIGEVCNSYDCPGDHG